MAEAVQIGNSSINAWPMLLFAGSSETHLLKRGAFQELDAVSLLSPHTKISVRPPSLGSIPPLIQDAYRISWYGRPGTGFVDLPADIIQGSVEDGNHLQSLSPVPPGPEPGVEETTLFKIAQLLKTAKAPLVVIGKGAAYARAEQTIRRLIDASQIPFLPTPMGKGIIADSHPLNAASARSTALREADVVLLLGARLNWILHFGDAPKWNEGAQFIQVDIDAETLGQNNPTPHLAIWGDIRSVVPQISSALGTWHYDPATSSYSSQLAASKEKNLYTASRKAAEDKIPMTYAKAFSTIESTLHRLSPPEKAGIVYVSEGANTMDISRSIFPVSYPRLRLDAGTHATMGVGMGYAIAAHEAYNGAACEAMSGPPESLRKRKKIVALEGDSAFGFSAMEVETMSRYGMDILIFVMNNGGVYHGDSDTAEDWLKMQDVTRQQSIGVPSPASKGTENRGLRSTSLGFEVAYEKIAEACGGSGYLVRAPEELAKATEAGFRDTKVCIINVVIESGNKGKLEFGWQASGSKKNRDKQEPKL